MGIDIDGLSEAELIDLNRKVVERLRLLQQVRAHRAMLEFHIGDRVRFQADGRGPVEGMLTRYNRKSVTVIPTTASTGTSPRPSCPGPPRRPHRNPGPVRPSSG
jgi:hypothetical protein